MGGKKHETPLACNVSSRDWWQKCERKLRILYRVVRVVPVYIKADVFSSLSLGERLEALVLQLLLTILSQYSSQYSGK